MFLRNISWLQMDYTVLYPGRQNCSTLPSLHNGPTLNIPNFSSLLFASHLMLNTLILYVLSIHECSKNVSWRGSKNIFLVKWENNKKTNDGVGELFKRIWSGVFVTAWKLWRWTVQWSSLSPTYSHKLCYYKITNVNKRHSPRLAEMLLGTDCSGTFPAVLPPVLLLALLHVLLSAKADDATSELCRCCCCVHFCGATILE
jgi:hypothetical protein